MRQSAGDPQIGSPASPDRARRMAQSGAGGNAGAALVPAVAPADTLAPGILPQPSHRVRVDHGSANGPLRLRKRG